MDIGYLFKKVMGTLTFDEEQEYRAKQAGARQEQVVPGLDVAPGARTAPAPEAVPRWQPGNALRNNQNMMDEATKELQRQNAPQPRSSLGTLDMVSGARSTMTPEQEAEERMKGLTQIGSRG